jgi:hypothetical protein
MAQKISALRELRIKIKREYLVSKAVKDVNHTSTDYHQGKMDAARAIMLALDEAMCRIDEEEE